MYHRIIIYCIFIGLSLLCLEESQSENAKDLSETMDVVMELLKDAAQYCMHIELTWEQLETLKDFRIPKGKKVGCFLDCVLQQAEIITDTGIVTPGLVRRNILAVSGNRDLAAMGFRIVERCDSDTYRKEYSIVECERAIFLCKCFLRNRRVQYLYSVTRRTTTTTPVLIPEFLLNNAKSDSPRGIPTSGDGPPEV